MKLVKLKILLFCFLILYSFKACTQNNTIDSLRNVLQTQKEDTAKVSTLNALSGKLSFKGDDKNALEYANEALLLAKKLNHKASLAGSYEALSAVYTNKEDFPESNKYLYLALKSFEEIGDQERSAHCLVWIGFNFFWQENYDQAFNAYSNALKIYNQIGDDKTIGVAHSFIFLAKIYWVQKKYTESLNYNSIGLKISIEEDYKQLAANAYTCIGDILSVQIPTLQFLKDNSTQSTSLNEALNNYLEALNNFREVQDYGGMADSYQHASEVNIRLNRYLEAQKYIDSALRIAKQFYIKDNLGKSYLIQSKLDSARGYYKPAYNHYKLYILYRDSILHEENIRKAEDYQLQYEIDKKENQIILLSTQNKLQSALTAKEGQRKNFAFIGIGVILLAGWYGFYRFKKRKQLQSKQALMAERLRISRELHDEVGATLSGIAMYSHLAKEQIKANQTTEIEKSLNIMQQSTGAMVNKLNDIVWLINPDQDTLQKLIGRLEEYAIDMAAIKNIKVKITVPDKIAEINLPIDSRRNIYLFCKEAINNAVKYSQATKLELSAIEIKGSMEFAVRDNGRGFDTTMVRRGNGLVNMQKRADAIGAKLILESKENEGASISLQYKIT